MWGAFCYARTLWFYDAQIPCPILGTDSLPKFFGGARPVTKPLAGRGRARIVGTIGGTAHRPRPSNSAV